MNKEIFIVVHGRSDFPYTKQCIDGFARYNPNVVWSSFNDTPQEIWDYLREKKVDFVDCGPLPEEKGMSMLNWQKTGFLYGLRRARDLGAKYVYKVRTDLDIPHLDMILDKLYYESKNGGKPLNILCFDEISNGFCDWCFFGEINEMELFWSFEDINVPSERGIAPQYFKKKGVDYNYTYDSALQLVETHINLYHEMKIPINWLKETKEDEHPITDHFGCSAIYH